MKKIPRWLKIVLGILFSLVLLLVLGFVAAYLAVSGNYGVPKTVEYNMDLPFIELGGYRFHGETFGYSDNPVVIVLHGGPGQDYRMLYDLKELKDEYFVVFYDQRGAGLSPRVPDEQITLEQYLLDLDAIVDNFSNGRSATLIGHSWGAMLASAYLGAHGEKLHGAVLAEPGFLNSKMGQQLMERTNWMQPSHLNRWEIVELGKTFFKSLHVQETDGHEPMDWFMSRVMQMPIEGHPLKGYYCGKWFGSAHLPQWRFGSRVSQVMLDSVVTEDKKVEANFTQGVEKFTNEVLFISSACNTIIGTDVQREHMKLFAQSTLVEIPYAGHTMFGEEPRRTLKAVREYLGRVAID